MESCGSRKPKTKPLLASFLMLSCLVLLLSLQTASAVPTSRSIQLRNLQHPPSLKLSSLQEMTAASGNQLQGRAMDARMLVEVNDYPGSGANNRHDPPKGPGRR